ncbi:tagaturonate reductase [Cryobacterium sp. MDB1-18-2]|uniref:tagaturonate reductase n=1 Tax=unclassified Cryobacterium TaxID=2649013 RepID=UPI00106D999A|nr:MULTISPECIES: tagaturonate reductase [unclassified Cryobacterium]TFC27766.1 tagaturonate reductase [Cryobacterium sp. MDB1-18-2]TFC39240.1 tagaturonate reductase [Cryobacterium sp. MDB1-18-1]
MTTQQLAQGIRLVEGHGGLAAVEVTTPSASALIYLHGAHVADWTPAGGKPVLWMSTFGVFSDTDPIRGGVPLCFPWFGPNGTDASAPNHGWARLSTWSLVDSRTLDTATGAVATELVFELTQDSVGVPAGFHPFTAHYTVTVGAELGLELSVRNDGATPFAFEEAFHTYFAVGDVTTSTLTGLETFDYTDRSTKPATEGSSLLPLGFTGDEIDRLYPMPEALELSDPANDRIIRAVSQGAAQTVVWNAGRIKAAAIADYGTDEWTETACAETCNVGAHFITLDPGATSTMQVTVTSTTTERNTKTMQRLSKSVVPAIAELPTKAIQFGEGNFLRAFVDWQLQQMNNQELFQGGVKIVQPIEGGRVASLEEQDNLYTVLLEGLQDGKDVQSHEVITVVTGTVNPYVDNQKYLDLANDDNIEFIFSNTTEAGIAFDDRDRLNDKPQHSFPGKLTALLFERFSLGKKGFQIIPCELIEHNGDKLKESVLATAALWELDAAFVQWVNTDNTFYSSLVDRIVPGYPADRAAELAEEFGYDDQSIVKAEPFLLWVIEGPQSLTESLPLAKAGLNVTVTDDMTPYRERKVFLLNAPHTTMASIARLAGVETVRDVMIDPEFSQFVNAEMYDEIMPVIDLPHDELAAYAESVKERFENRFMHHELASIALNSISKYKSRLLPILVNFHEKVGTFPPRVTLALSALLLTYSGDAAVTVVPVDSDEVLATFHAAYATATATGSNVTADYVEAILSDDSLWGRDLTELPGLVAEVTTGLDNLRTLGARATIALLA